MPSIIGMAFGRGKKRNLILNAPNIVIYWNFHPNSLTVPVCKECVIKPRKHDVCSTIKGKKWVLLELTKGT